MYPFTSAMRCADAWVKMHTLPPSPILEITKFGEVPPGVRLRFDAVGCGDPHGQTVTYPAPSAPVPVTFIATAVALSGTCEVPTPVTSTETTAPAAGLPPE